MKINKLAMQLMVVFAVSFSPLTQALTIDYEGAEIDMEGDEFGGVGYIEDGYQTTTFLHALHSAWNPLDSSIGIQMDETTGGRFLATDGSNFDLESMQIISIRNALPDEPVFIIDGVDDNGLVQASMKFAVNFTGIIDFTADNQEWTNLDALHFHFVSNGGYGVNISNGERALWDNIVLTPTAVNEITKRVNLDNKFDSPIMNSYGKDLQWDSDWELRWLDFNYTGIE